jgi:hypothetical protein
MGTPHLRLAWAPSHLPQDKYLDKCRLKSIDIVFYRFKNTLHFVHHCSRRDMRLRSICIANRKQYSLARNTMSSARKLGLVPFLSGMPVMHQKQGRALEEHHTKYDVRRNLRRF